MNDRDNGAPGGKLPVKIGTTTNGEFAPKPLPKASIAANQVALSRADAISKALGVTRRQFLAAVSGVDRSRDSTGSSGGASRLTPNRHSKVDGR